MLHTNSEKKGKMFTDYIVLFLSIFIIEWFNSGWFSIIMNRIPGMIKYGFLIIWLFLCLVTQKERKDLFDKLVFLLLFIAYMYTVQGMAQFQRYVDVIDVYLKNFMYFGICFVMYWYYADESRKSFAKIIIVYLVSETIVIALSTYLQLQINPDAARLYTARLKYAENLEDVNLNLFGSFNFFYGIIPFMLFLVYCAKQRLKSKGLCLVLFAVLYFIAVAASFSTILLVTIIFILIMFVHTAKISNAQKFAIYAFILGISMVLKGPIAYVFLELSKLEGLSDIVRTRAIEIYQAMSGIVNDDSGLVLRLDLYLKSIRAFFKSPILGIVISSNLYLTGGHSTFQDLLAYFGLLNILFYLYLKKVFQYIYENTKPALKRFVSLYVACYIVLCLLNPMISAQISIYWFVLIPLLCKYTKLNGDKNENNSNQFLQQHESW